ncbi:MAG: phosphonate monoester hydrolase, partial [Planctomycetota bacterium]
NLLPACRDAEAPVRDAAFSEIAVRAGDGLLRITMVRTDRYKYAVTESAQPIMLFDLAADPLEQHNLAADPAAADLRADLDRRIHHWLLETQVCM